jgi:hypothetical protein
MACLQMHAGRGPMFAPESFPSCHYLTFWTPLDTCRCTIDTKNDKCGLPFVFFSLRKLDLDRIYKGSHRKSRHKHCDLVHTKQSGLCLEPSRCLSQFSRAAIMSMRGKRRRGFNKTQDRTNLFQNKLPLISPRCFVKMKDMNFVVVW